jgi:acyl-CoA thioester hydrolase
MQCGQTVALFRLELPVRWRDLDAYDHVNNSQFLSYIEEARIQWFGSLPGPWRDAAAEPILAAAQINFRRPITYPATLVIELQTARIGTTSITVNHTIVDASDADTLYSDGNSVIVWVSPQSGRPVPLPEVVRQAAERGL